VTEHGNQRPETFAAAYPVGDGDIRFWKERYYNLEAGYQLLEATLHEVRNSHRAGIRPDYLRFHCQDCGWTGRESNYANT
jgi:hypothetical protein